ncbi:MAG: efflux RND transporter periplasmic adaptor subunit [Bryobacteraceae bacterium]|nr:efflux RND transporter periplasmic adaptor subunit [Bryobacteraceae bacterium]
MNLSAVPARKLARHLTLCALPLLLLSACTKQQPVQARQEAAAIDVKVVAVSTRDIRRVVQSIGTLFPFDETVVSAEIDGRVMDVKADLGDSVAKGAVLVRIADEEQKYILAQNEASLRMALERIGLKNENDRIKDVRQSSEVRRAQADLSEAEQRYNRTKSLVDQGIASRSDYDQAQARLSSTRATYDQAINSVGNLLQDIERQKAVVELQRKKLRDTTVHAPFAGRVKERSVNTGQYVRTNTPLFTLVKTDPLRLRIEVPERLAPWIRNGQIAEVQMEAFEDRKLRDKVWRISPTVDQSKRTFVVEALVDNPRNELKPGSYARASLPTEKVERIRLIPVKAVTYLFGANKAFVVRNGNTIESREVKIGDRIDADVEILEGLEEGEIVATSQLARLDTGVRVATSRDTTVAKSEKKAD